MSQHPDESGLVPDDHLLVRPYVAPSGRPPRSTAPAWPQTGPLAFPGPARGPQAGGPDAVPARAPADARGAIRRAADPGSRSRLPLAVGTLLALAVVGALVLLLGGPEPEPPRTGPPPELSLPVLPARSPDADATGGSRPTASVRSGEPSATTTTEPSPTGSEDAEPTPLPSASPRPSSAYVTLRMGDKGPEVRALQEMLYGQGFTYVSVTGVYDGQTKRGVSQLQRDRSIKGDPQGVYGPATQAAMR
ncbi:peptidoglycan-binding domain-containing protein [Streptomyces sp. MB09-01]|uniref:peptidoglycan-binding domain-containing protein n=1 Tax=Streptomyces sp. MB09-01 TaxID=3028666 RepID=UPI0029A6C852|nr:peptidoglycan-binding domain-containing protein [Streptomyces sp. MB09-01]MDX3536235.1 peptidoglycan-binding domain-containing protein [Streptomyces sp. MB09-01]